MTTETIDAGKFAEQIEQALRDRGQEEVIPAGGLWAWVNQAWPPTNDNLDPDDWATDWIEQIRRSRDTD